MKFLEMIQYNLYVRGSLYFKYYLELKSVFPEDLSLKPMDIFTARSASMGLTISAGKYYINHLMATTALV